MLEVNIDASEVTRLAKLLEQSPAVIETAKREAIAAAAPKMKAIVDQAIGGSGKVRSWQGQYVGSKGLYAAVRPRAKTYTEATKGGKRYAVGYVTNAINSGHRFPRDAWGYRSRAGSVPGKKFYQNAAERLGQVTKETAESISRVVVSHLSGENTGTSSSNSLPFMRYAVGNFTLKIGNKTLF